MPLLLLLSLHDFWLVKHTFYCLCNVCLDLKSVGAFVFYVMFVLHVLF